MLKWKRKEHKIFNVKQNFGEDSITSYSVFPIHSKLFGIHSFAVNRILASQSLVLLKGPGVVWPLPT